MKCHSLLVVGLLDRRGQLSSKAGKARQGSRSALLDLTFLPAGSRQIFGRSKKSIRIRCNFNDSEMKVGSRDSRKVARRVQNRATTLPYRYREEERSDELKCLVKTRKKEKKKEKMKNCYRIHAEEYGTIGRRKQNFISSIITTVILTNTCRQFVSFPLHCIALHFCSCFIRLLHLSLPLPCMSEKNCKKTCMYTIKNVTVI